MGCTTIDHHIAFEGGLLFARRWTPGGAAPGRAPIVLLHDSLGSVALWRSFPAVLAVHTGRSVVAYDRPGFGASSARHGALPASFIEDEAVTAFAALREHFGIDRFIAFGHSVGGGMAVHCAARYPEVCAGLVTESAQSFVEDRTREGILAAKAQFALRGAMERLARYHGDKAAWVLSAWTDTWLSPAFRDWTLDAVLPRVNCPVLVLHGGDDEYGSHLQPERIARGVSGPSELDIIPGVRHVPHREREAWVASRVARFLEALP
jgi:pimeloyl-ACP methyl ester carboxylesterase